MKPFDERCAQTALVLRGWLAEHDIALRPDDTVSDKVASRLCGFRSAGALAARIREGLSVPRHRSDGVHRLYRVADIAAWIECGYADAFGQNGGF